MKYPFFLRMEYPEKYKFDFIFFEKIDLLVFCDIR